MNRFYLTWILLALICILPVTCQDETQPYFALSTSHTFGSRDTPDVAISAVNVPAVQIRVYRVKDPTQFFRQLEDTHSFGGRSPRPVDNRSPIESLRSWKRGLRRNIRLFLRGQFTESVSAHFKSKKPLPQTAQNKATYFAETPVLNQEQLVLSFTQALKSGNAWSSANVPVAVRDKGVYLVEAVSQKMRAYTILLKSDLVLSTKAGQGRLMGFVADRYTGEPVADAQISTMMRNGSPSASKTDANGFTELAAPEALKGNDDLRVMAQKGSDITFAALSLWSYGKGSRPWTGYIYTDRPVYRPGDSMHFRAILRTARSSNGYDVPANQTVAVQVTDPEGKSVYQKQLTTNDSGIIHDELPIDRKAPLGNYYVQVTQGDSNMNGNFEVQEYKKPEYEVRVTPDKPRLLEGEKTHAVIDSRYYFGEPVKNAKVQYSVYRNQYWYPLWRDTDDDSPQMQQDSDEGGEEVLNQTGQLDADGKLTIPFTTTVSDRSNDFRYRIEARVTDQAKREIAGSGWLVATYGTFMVNVEPLRYVYDASATGDFKVSAIDYDGKPVATTATVSLRRWRTGDRNKTLPVIRSTRVSVGADGTGTAKLALPAEGGSYYVDVEAQSGNGRRVKSRSYVWIAGTGEATFAGGESPVVQIVPDKKRYQPGENAQILISTGRRNTPVFVTIEGRDVRQQKLLRSEGSSVIFNYKVSANDEPGFFVSAQYIRDGELHQGQKRIKVPPVDHQLNVALTTDKPQYQPGQNATYNLKITSTDGRPVSKADFSLGVVDEAIYAIKADATPDILTFFYGNEWNRVNSQNSLSYYFSGEAGNRRMMLVGGTAESSAPLAQLKEAQLAKPKVRKDFSDTAFWAADLTTDATGTATTRVRFPDSLTTWRATARGVGPGDRFGNTTAKTVVRKNLIMRLATPRFFVQGDETVISGIVQNYLATAKHARVTIKAEGLDVINGASTQEVDIASKGEVKVDWRVKTKQAAQAKITGQALTDEESDALEVSLPVKPQGVSIHQANGGSVNGSGTANYVVNFPADAEQGSRSVSIRLSSSIAGSVFNGLDFLTSFPYGCVEQTMSSFLPNLMVSKAVRELGVQKPIDQAKLDEQVTSGLDRIYNMQHADDGGWGWWPSDESHPFMTAYVVAGLAEAKANGVQIQASALSKGVGWLKTDLQRHPETQADLRAYMGYALAKAGAADRAVLNSVYENRAKLTAYGNALLGLAFETVKDSRAAAIAGDLEKSAKQNDQEAWWPSERDTMLDFDADVSPEATAYAVKLLTHQRANSPLLSKAAFWLVNHRNEGYWWSSSKQTAMVIYGLLDYLKASKELQPDFTATVTVNGKSVGSQVFKADSATNGPEIFLNESKLQPGANQIVVTTKGSGKLYYSVTGTHYSNQAQNAKQGKVSLNVLRDYFRLTPGKKGDRIVYDLAALDGSVKSGDVLAVRLAVTGSDWKYLLAEDPIPAGTEFIERDNLYELNNRPPWWRYSFSRRELHDDHMAIFQTYFSEGQQQYFYLLKVVNPGLFHAGPARVQPMYQPGIDATTEARQLEVK